MSRDFVHMPRPRDGPVLMTRDFQLDEAQARELDSFVNELRLFCGGTLFKAFVVRNQLDDYLRFLERYRIEYAK